VQFGADEGSGRPAGEEIAEAAAQGHGGVEGAAAEHEGAGMLVEAGGDANDILGTMLSIGVGGDDAGQAGEDAEGVVDAGVERRALAEIDGVAQDPDAGESRRLVENFAELGPAAVVDQEDGGHAAGGEAADEIDQSGGGPVGGDEDDAMDGLVRLHNVRASLGWQAKACPTNARGRALSNLS
jgi:hypothetical protein